jgi:IPT/TIG domain
VIISCVLFVVTFLAAYTLIQLWPEPLGTTDSGSQSIDTWLWWQGNLSNETRLFVIVLSAGGLGGLAHAVRSLYWYVGNRNFRSSWILMYLCLPATGAGIALLTYLLLRGGFTTSIGDSTNVNPYGVAAISALSGLFAREAVEKLKTVFTTLLSPAEKGKDSLYAATIDSFIPEAGSVGDRITVHGIGLSSVTQVTFAPGITIAAKAKSDNVIEVIVPEGAETGPVTLTGPSGIVTTADQFVVRPPATLYSKT